MANIQKMSPAELSERMQKMNPVSATRFYNRCMTNPDTPDANLALLRQYRAQNPERFAPDTEVRGNRGQRGSWMYGRGYGSGYGGQYRDRRNGRVYDGSGFSYDNQGNRYDNRGNNTGGYHDGGSEPFQGYGDGRGFSDFYGAADVRPRSGYRRGRNQRKPVSVPRSYDELYQTISGLNGDVARTRYFMKVLNNPETPEETKQNLVRLRNSAPQMFVPDDVAQAAGPQVQRRGFWAAHWKSQEEFDSMTPKEKKFFVKAFQGRNRNGNSSYALKVLTNPEASIEDKQAVTSVVQKNPDLYFRRKNGRNPYNRNY